MIKVGYIHVDGQIRYISEKLNVEHFPDNTLLLKTPNIDFSKHIEIEWYYESDVELFAIICLAKKAKSKSLIMPYCPHARQDRIKGIEDTFTLKYFAEVINSLGFESVTVLDPHSPVCEALIDNIIVQHPRKQIVDALVNIPGVDVLLYFPDAGAAKRYSDLIPGYKYLYGNKKRRWEDGIITGTEVVNPFNVEVEGKTILIIDDICSRGTTFVKSAEALKELGVGNIYLYVTHCENTILDGDVLTSGLIEKVFTTNSIFTKEHEKIKVLELN